MVCFRWPKLLNERLVVKKQVEDRGGQVLIFQHVSSQQTTEWSKASWSVFVIDMAALVQARAWKFRSGEKNEAVVWISLTIKAALCLCLEIELMCG